MNKKLITAELINKKLEVKGFGDYQANDEDLAKESVLHYYNIELTDDYSSSANFYMYEESTADGYSVFVATHDQNVVNVNENVYYYDSDLGGALIDYIKYSNGDEENPEIVYVDDLNQDFIDDAMIHLFEYLSEVLEEEIIDELTDEGYELEKLKVEL
jgi:hypothetical protein